MSHDLSYTDALSSLNVNDILREIDEKTIFRGIEPASSRPANGPQPTAARTAAPSLYDDDMDIRRGIQSLARKAEHCDRLLESIAAERTRMGGATETAQTPTLTSLAREVAVLREGQAQIVRVLESMQAELRMHSAGSLPSPAAANVGSVSPALAPLSAPSLPAPPLGYDVTSDPKYKELKKKLLVANLKILELQNKTPSK